MDSGNYVLQHRQRMDSRTALARELKAEGATRIAFHPDGSLAEVEFGPSVQYETQAEDHTPAEAPYRSPLGRLVPRASRDT
jgi:hypothetical protein